MAGSVALVALSTQLRPWRSMELWSRLPLELWQRLVFWRAFEAFN
jgi:hypothetical protein